MRLTSTNTTSTSSSQQQADSVGVAATAHHHHLLQPPRRKISLELKAWEDSLAGGNTSFSSFPKSDLEHESSNNDQRPNDQDYDGKKNSKTSPKQQHVPTGSIDLNNKNKVRRCTVTVIEKRTVHKEDNDELQIRSRRISKHKKMKSQSEVKESSTPAQAAAQTAVNDTTTASATDSDHDDNDDDDSSQSLSVSFYPRVRIRRIKSLYDTDEEVIERMYYSPDELQLIRDIAREKVQHFVESTDIVWDDDDEEDNIMDDDEEHDHKNNYGTNISQRMTNDNLSIASVIARAVGSVRRREGFCLRGLENELPDVKQRRRMIKHAARKAVMQEQDRQFREGYVDPYQLAFVYKRQVQSSIQSAFLAASRDAWDAKKIHSS